MALLTLQEMKIQLRISPAQSAEDDLLNRLSDAAEEYITAYINKPIPEPTPSSIKSAALLIVGDLYENREGQTVGGAYAINPTVQNLLFFHRTNMGI